MFQVSLKGANEGIEKVIAVSKEPTFAYDNAANKRTETVEGVTYNVILHCNGYTQLPVKIKGDDPLQSLTSEQLQDANANGTPIFLVFKGARVSSGANKNGREYLSCNATGVELANAEKAMPPLPAMGATRK
jgi:hypothetical protein